MESTIYMQLVPLGKELYRVDLFKSDATKDFLGIAFKLNIKSSDKEHLKFVKYELSPSFSILKGGQKPIVLIKDFVEAKQNLVFGMTLKSHQFNLDQGKIISFYFQATTEFKNPVSFEFDRQVFTIFDQKRIDLKNIDWKNLQTYIQNDKNSENLKNVALDPLETKVQSNISSASLENDSSVKILDYKTVQSEVLPTDLAEMDLSQSFSLEDLKNSSSNNIFSNLGDLNFHLYFVVFLVILFFIGFLFQKQRKKLKDSA